MLFRITLNAFSGRKNPTWLLSKKQAKKFTSYIEKNKSRSMYKIPNISYKLGYTGFAIKALKEKDFPKKMYLKSDVLEFEDTKLLSHIFFSNTLEKWLLSTGKKHMTKKVYKFILNQITHPDNTLSALERISSIGEKLYTPRYLSSWWNDDPIIKESNNCYNYANNLATDTFAQPGRGTGEKYTSLDCKNVEAAAIRDGLKRIKKGKEEKGNLVYLAIAPKIDYHWWRLDDNNYWSHKPGSTDVINVDTRGNLITDPESCDRGIYTVSCCFLLTEQKKIKIE